MLYTIYKANGKTFIYPVATIRQAEKILEKAWKYYGEIKDPNITATKPQLLNR